MPTVTQWTSLSEHGSLSLFIAYSDWSVAVPTMWRHFLWLFAFRQAVWTPKFFGLTSSAITRSQVKLGLPGGRFQDRGGFCIAAQTARRWSSVDCARARALTYMANVNREKSFRCMCVAVFLCDLVASILAPSLRCCYHFSMWSSHFQCLRCASSGSGRLSYNWLLAFTAEDIGIRWNDKHSRWSTRYAAHPIQF